MICFSRVFERTVFDGAPVFRRFTWMVCLLRVFEGAIRIAMSASFHRGASVEFARPRCGGNVGTTVVHRSQQSAVATGGVLMLRLFGSHGDVVLAHRFHLSRRRTSSNSVAAAIKADAADVVVDDRRVVGIVNDGDVHVGHRAVVVVVATSPVAAEKADTGVAETVVNATVEADFGSPVARRPFVEAVFESPIPWSPQKADFRRGYPGSGNPEVAVRPVGPVARSPDVARSRTDGRSEERRVGKECRSR